MARVDRPAPPAPTVRQRQLGMALRALREEKGLSATAAAKKAACSQTKITRIEQGLTKVSKGDLLLMLDVYGVTDPGQQESYWTLAMAGRQRGWWAAYKEVMSEKLSDYIAFETEATKVLTWSLGTVHGLLQTEEYARATFAGGTPMTPAAIDRVVAARMERQRRVDSDLTIWAILDESLLMRPVGGARVLRDQLDHLLALPDAVTLQVVPMGTNWHPGLSSAFTLMNFAGYPPVAFVEAPVEDQYVDVPEVVATYTLMFDQLRAAGANPRESKRMIKAARDRIET